MDGRVPIYSSEVRIVPLIASATEVVHALGLGEHQVGRSHECDFPKAVQKLPVCTRPAIPVDGDSAEIDRLVKSRVAAAASVYEVDSDMIASLNPTHIITQTQCKVCAVSREDVERALRDRTSVDARIVSLEPYSLADIWKDVLRVAEACGCSTRGEELVESLQSELILIHNFAHRSSWRPRVVALEWLEPLMCSGNWMPELIAMANAVPVLGSAGEHTPYVAWEELVAADPDVIICMPCGFDIARTRTEMHWLTSRPNWEHLKAVRTGQIYLCDGNQYMNRPGPRIIESLQILCEILHHKLFPATFEGTGWERMETPPAKALSAH